MDVFISYSRKDREIEDVDGGNVISSIQAVLKDNDITYWLDEEGIHSGETFASVLSRNIADSKILLFISSINSNASRWTCGEIATAHSYDKKIIPFKIDDAPYDASISIYVAALESIDYSHRSARAMRQLVKLIKQYLMDIETESFIKIKEQEKKEVEEALHAVASDICNCENERDGLVKALNEIKTRIAQLTALL